MLLALSFAALFAFYRIVKYIDDTVSFWEVKAKLDAAVKETNEYEAAGHVLNAQAGLRRVRILATELEKYR